MFYLFKPFSFFLVFVGGGGHFVFVANIKESIWGHKPVQCLSSFGFFFVFKENKSITEGE